MFIPSRRGSGATADGLRPPPCAAAQLGPQDRKQLSVAALIRTETMQELSARHGVSRKFVYAQAAKATEALDAAFEPTPRDHQVLFYLPVTKHWIEQAALGLTFICHSSLWGAAEFFGDLLDYSISPATISNLLHQTVESRPAANENEALSKVIVGAHDEIYQGRKPVLVGADLPSTYCYLLAAEDHADETTWGVHLLNLQDRGFAPDYTIADAGKGLRAGQAAAMPDTPCHGDVFHAERDLSALATDLSNRASGCRTAVEKLEHQMARACKRRQGQKLSKRLALARQAEGKAVQLAADVQTLADWMQHDILSVAGPCLAARQELFDFIVTELRGRESLCPHRIRPVCTMLENQRPHLLAFVGVLDERLDAIASQSRVAVELVHAVCELQGRDRNQPAYWTTEAALREQLRSRFYEVETAVLEAMEETPRASSIVENLNSRLRNYFFLRRHLGDDYLELLRFYLNHRRFLRSRRPQRVGKSPAELLTGHRHPHWLELLGYQRFQRN